MHKNPSIAIIGLGYVGLPLVIEFNKKYPTIGFDVSEERIKQLKKASIKHQKPTKKN